MVYNRQAPRRRASSNGSLRSAICLTGSSPATSCRSTRPATNVLDGAKDRLAALLAYRVAKNAAEQPDIVTQRHVLVSISIAFGFGMGPLLDAVVDGAPSWQELCLATR